MLQHSIQFKKMWFDWLSSHRYSEKRNSYYIFHFSLSLSFVGVATLQKQKRKNENIYSVTYTLYAFLMQLTLLHNINSLFDK